MQDLSILVIHNRYQQPGGEDTVVRAEVNLLRNAGHRVITYFRDNAAITRYGLLRKACLAVSTTWDRQTYADIRTLIRNQRPDIAHCHNFLPLVSPAAYDACKSAGIQVVQTLHNYRLLCPAGTLFSRGRRCQYCTRNLTQGISGGCYRKSRVQTAIVSLMLHAHRLRGTWKRSVDAYVTPSRFSRGFFVSAGLPEEKVHVKPNFLIQDPGQRTKPGDYALFVGRLSAEKGVLEMISAWSRLKPVKLLIIGDGPLYDEARDAARRAPGHIKLLGQLDAPHTLAYMKAARFLVFPSRWYEPFGMVLLEAAACGVPAIASCIGAIPELVADRRTGLLFDPDNFDELVEQVWWAWTHPVDMERMGAAARQLYLDNFTAEKNYEALIAIYRKLLPA
jgi:glycosyltransferase involved in cell wall biosynthesis